MANSHPFVCVECWRTVHDKFKQYTERLEWRRIDGNKTRALFTLRDLCEECVDKLIEQRRNPEHVEQPDLFSRMEALTEQDDSL